KIADRPLHGRPRSEGHQWFPPLVSLPKEWILGHLDTQALTEWREQSTPQASSLCRSLQKIPLASERLVWVVDPSEAKRGSRRKCCGLGWGGSSSVGCRHDVASLVAQNRAEMVSKPAHASCSYRPQEWVGKSMSKLHAFGLRWTSGGKINCCTISARLAISL